MNNRTPDVPKVWIKYGSILAGALLSGVVAGAVFAHQPAGTNPGFNPKDSPKLFPKDGRKPGAPAPAGGGERVEAAEWSIVLVAFRGPDADELARKGLEKVKRVAGITNAYSEKRSRSTIIAVGKYTDPTGGEAIAERDRIRKIEAEGGLPFANAFLAPPERIESLGSRPEFNLLSARAEFGKVAKYTLQVGAYGPGNPNSPPTDEERRDARKAAEAAAEQLRREGELAYYYHGPNLSMVTIGVFNDDVLKDQKFEPPELQELRVRFPHSLYNGAGVKERRTTVDKNGKAKEQLVMSKLVGIPKEATVRPSGR